MSSNAEIGSRIRTGDFETNFHDHGQGAGWRNPRASGERWTNGYATGCGPSSSCNGSEARRCSGSCAPLGFASLSLDPWRQIPGAGGAIAATP
jgi:hypothetical protein